MRSRFANMIVTPCRKLEYKRTYLSNAYFADELPTSQGRLVFGISRPRGNSQLPIEKKSIKELLAAWRAGDDDARNELISRFYRELTELAEKVLRRERRGRHLSITTGDLVNETVARLLKSDSINAVDRAHLMALSATVMRQFLVDRARAKNSAKRKGLKVTFNEAAVIDPTDEAGMIELNDALELLRSIDPVRADLFEYHYFVGMTHEEIAAVVGMSRSTVRRHCIAAAEYLRDRLDHAD